jgi:two-component system nitrate/nitrite sensor histidine kinase NarX
MKPDAGIYPTDNRRLTVRSRLLLKLLGLLLVLALFWLVVFSDRLVAISTEGRIVISAIVLLAGLWLARSVLVLVQASTSDPHGQISNRVRSLREGRHTDTMPQQPDPSCAELASNLHHLDSRPGNPSRNSGEAADSGKLGSKSLQILYEIVSSINTAHGVDDLLTRFLFVLKRVTDAQAATIWVAYSPSRIELAASSGLDESLILPDRADIRRSLYERAMTEGKIWVDATLAKYEKIAGRPFFDRRDIGLVSVPMRYRGKIIGVINLFLEQGIIEEVDTLKPLLISIGHHLSIAIERFRNDEESRKHLIKDERTRIAHELHDSLAQSLASIRYQVRVLDETLHQGDESTTWQQLEVIENSLDEANNELRELIANFRAPLSMRGLIVAIEQIVSQFRHETGIKTYLQKEWTNGSLPEDTEIQILRIIQEALWNIRKHSRAKTVRIMLRHQPNGRYHILIEDDGVGISKQVYGSPGEHIGLTIMRERAERIGGTLRVESEPGEGTRVVLVLGDPKGTG